MKDELGLAKGRIVHIIPDRGKAFERYEGWKKPIILGINCFPMTEFMNRRSVYTLKVQNKFLFLLINSMMVQNISFSKELN